MKYGLTVATCFPTHVCYGGIHVGFILCNTRDNLTMTLTGLNIIKICIQMMSECDQGLITS